MPTADAAPPMALPETAARFVADGLLVLPGAVERSANEELLRSLDAGLAEWSGPAASLPADGPLAAFTEVAEIRALADALLGTWTWGGHKAHVTAPGSGARCWHADGAIDRRLGFDLLLYWFPQAVDAAVGPTSFLPGSQYRRVHQEDVAQYQFFVGELQVTGPPGTVVLSHHAIWHTANRNASGASRPMIKVRLDGGPFGSSHALAAHAHEPEVIERLSVDHRWYGNDYRLEVLHRIRRWRVLTGDDAFDIDGLASRMLRR